jgi:hypothetical protein
MSTFLTDEQEIYELYEQAKSESITWREDYHEYERLADNGLMDNLDPALPEVNDGSLAASLFKLPKRIVNSNLKGRAKSVDRDEAWITELANIQWENKIIPNANSQAPFHRKWKDAVRKAAIYGSVPIISLFVERGDYVGTDFVVAQPQDVTLEPGKVSDYDSDIMFWDVYYTTQQVRAMLEEAKGETKLSKESKDEGSEEEAYNKWDIKGLEAILAADQKEGRDSRDDHREVQTKDVKKTGIHFCIVFQRGVDAPFYMYHKSTKKTVRSWKNQDPSGDLPIHFLYCYQDFINPYGVGIVKLAGGTQNVLDYMRQADILATQLGLRPPISIAGNIDNVDLDSIVNEQDALWITGDASVKREEFNNQIYSQLPNRIGMYKISLDQLLPTGDTSISAASGDANYSKTAGGVKARQANLSIDDDDFKDNLYMTYEAVAKSLINIQFANMQGSDIMKLSDDERDRLTKAGLEFPMGADGTPTNELEVLWDESRSTFDFTVDAEDDKSKDEETRLEGLLKVLEFTGADPEVAQELQMAGKKFNKGELLSSIIALLTDNDKIITDLAPEEMASAEQMMMQQQGAAPEQEQHMMPNGQMMAGPMTPEMGGTPQQGMQQQAPQGMPEQAPQMPQEGQIDPLTTIMQQYGVDEPTAQAMLAAEAQGFEPEEILQALERQGAMNA